MDFELLRLSKRKKNIRQVWYAGNCLKFLMQNICLKLFHSQTVIFDLPKHQSPVLPISFLLMPVWDRLKVTVWERKNFQKHILRKKFAKYISRDFLSLGFKILGFYHFCYSQFGRHQRSQFDNKPFSKKFFPLNILSMYLS